MTNVAKNGVLVIKEYSFSQPQYLFIVTSDVANFGNVLITKVGKMATSRIVKNY